MNYDWEYFKSSIMTFQKEKRYKHTIGVANEALNLGRIFLPQKAEKLYLAGLLHDITKELSKEEHLSLCEKYGIIIDSNIAPKLLHAKTGAELARELYGKDYVDNEVYNGIFYHTTGRAEMTLFEIIIYLADYIEEGRTFEDCIYLRNYFYDNLENAKSYEEKLEILRKTMVLSFDLTIKNLIDEEKRIDKDTIDSRNYFLTTKIKEEK
jgi:nicotinate-nucleotide adenylyltransferase